MEIRSSTEKDLDAVLQIYEGARTLMRKNGNLRQWNAGYPGRESFLNDIRNSVSYVVIGDGGGLAGTFAFIAGLEPTYRIIYGGEWKDDSLPYGTIHRLAALPGHGGISEACFDWCKARCGSLRADTHVDNKIMQHVLLKAGFAYCGIIHLMNGDERLAYQWVDACRSGQITR